MRTLEIIIRNTLYGITFILGTLALTAICLVVLPNLKNVRDPISFIMVFGAATSIAPLAIAVTVIPLCLAIAFDRLVNP